MQRNPVKHDAETLKQHIDRIRHTWNLLTAVFEQMTKEEITTISIAHHQSFMNNMPDVEKFAFEAQQARVTLGSHAKNPAHPRACHELYSSVTTTKTIET